LELGEYMKKLLSIVFLTILASNVAFAADLGENMASDCVSTQQSSRFQQTVSDAPASSTVDSSSTSSGR